MNKAGYGSADPIMALASPRAPSALALFRCSGEGALELSSRIFSRPRALLKARGNSSLHGWLLDPQTGEQIDEVMLTVYRAPRSFTGEEGIDISCHGSLAVIQALEGALIKAGFRQALPGEFSFRAFMNGKLDLTRAESVMELVEAKTQEGRLQALRRLSGRLEAEISAIARLLAEVLAGAEIYLDYSEDEVSVSTEEEIAGRLPQKAQAEEALSRLQKLSELWQEERIYAEGALAVIAGRPNAGKSSLFNYLLREDRSIVSARAGTTRDWIEALIALEGIPLRLIDTAGLREAEEDEEAERMGIERTMELLDRADLVIYVIDGALGINEEDRDFILRHGSQKPLIALWNKADLGGFSEGPYLRVSAATGEGIPSLLSLMAETLKGPQGGKHNTHEETAPGPGSQRQKDLIDSSIKYLSEALELSNREEALDLIAPLIREALSSLGEITGEISSMEILELMFSNFCVGK